MRFLTFSAAMLISTTSSIFGACNDLFISEYIEGSSYNKAIELYNPTNNDIDLSTYSLELYSNGKTTPNATVVLSGTVKSNEVFVISHANADAVISVQSDLVNSSVINFNGDDAVVLKNNSDVVDAFGQVGTDPGSEWSSNGVGTKDETLVRINDQICGDTDPSDLFDPSVTFESFAKDTFEYIGSFGDSDNGAEEPEETITFIHEIQGSDMQSTMLGSTVSIEAIVVGDYQQNGGFNGFFVEEEDVDQDGDPATSEGLFVYCPSCSDDIAVGDQLKITGTISEYNGLTQIKPSVTTLIASAQPLPTAIELSFPVSKISDYENVEGMLVRLNAGENPLVVSENYDLGRYGSFTVASERLVQFTQLAMPNSIEYTAHKNMVALKSLIVDDGSSYQNPWEIPFPVGGLSFENTLRSGYTINTVTGIMDERYGSYRIQSVSPESLEFIANTNPRATAPEKPKKTRTSMRVTSFNVLNYFNTFEGCNGGVNGESVGCRGAEDTLEFERQRNKIINAMLEIDADVYGLMEIENDGYDTDSALADLVNGLNEKAGKNIYRYINVDEKLGMIDALGTDAIKVALIYNKKRVRAIGKPHAVILDDHDKNRPSLIQVFKPKRSFNRVAVSVNHFKSKGSPCDDLIYDNQNDVDKNDGQGNCNLTRTYAANVLISYFESNKQLKRVRNRMLLGDFNAYAKEDPIRTMENAGYINAIASELSEKEYSYIYKAEAGTLDYALVNERLSKKVKSVNVWHINTDEPRILDYNFNYKTETQHSTMYDVSAYRSSDHDPVIMDIKL